MLESYQKGQKPPLKMNLDEWADQYRYMNATTGEKWFTDRVEVARGPMRAVTEPGVRTITVMCSTQLLKTELILNTIGYFAHLDPCPILVVHPKKESAQKFSHTRLKQMVSSSPVLREVFFDSNANSSADTTLYKEFLGGHIAIVSAKTPADLAMLPIRVVLLDEIDKFDESSGKEGDPIDLAEERQAKYANNSLSIRACSPTTKDLSRIEASYLDSDQRKPFVPCPHCNHYQIMRWPNVHWDKDEEGNGIADTAQYHCESCGAAWTENDRLQSLKKIRWLQTAQFTCSHCNEVNKPALWDANDKPLWNEHGHAICQRCEKGTGTNRHAGFWANKLYSPFRPLSDMVSKWLEIKGNVEKLKMFINTQLAETFEESGERIESIDRFLSKRERYDAELPSEAGVITAGIDTQNNRLEIEVVAWGRDEESWSIEHKVIAGDPSQPEVWAQLDKFLGKPFTRFDGRLGYINAVCIDMGGGHTQHVANYCRNRIASRVWPIRGVGGDGRPLPVWPKNPSRGGRQNVPFYNIGVDSAKNVIFSRLFIDQPGPGYCHFPMDREDEWFRQLTAEKRVTKFRGARKILIWDNPKKARNEAFDCRVYAYAALQGLIAMGINLNRICEEESWLQTPAFAQEESSGNIVHRPSMSSPRSSAPRRKTSVKSNFMDR